MSADSDLVQEALDNYVGQYPTRADRAAYEALARLKAAAEEEREYTIFHEDGPIRLTQTELCNDYMKVRAERDALAEALRRMSDTINAPVWPKNVRDAARAALAEAGL